MRKIRLTDTQKKVLALLYANGGLATLYCGVRTYSEWTHGNMRVAQMNGTVVEIMQLNGLISNADGFQGIRKGGDFRMTKPGLLAHQRGWHDGRAGNGPNGEPRWSWDGPELWEGL